MSRASPYAPTIDDLTSVSMTRASIDEALGRPPHNPLDAIASGMGKAMAEAVYAPADGLRADWEDHCRKHGLCGR